MWIGDSRSGHKRPNRPTPLLDVPFVLGSLCSITGSCRLGEQASQPLGGQRDHLFADLDLEGAVQVLPAQQLDSRARQKPER